MPEVTIELLTEGNEAEAEAKTEGVEMLCTGVEEDWLLLERKVDGKLLGKTKQKDFWVNQFYMPSHLNEYSCLHQLQNRQQ